MVHRILHTGADEETSGVHAYADCEDAEDAWVVLEAEVGA